MANPILCRNCVADVPVPDGVTEVTCECGTVTTLIATLSWAAAVKALPKPKAPEPFALTHPEPAQTAPHKARPHQFWLETRVQFKPDCGHSWAGQIGTVVDRLYATWKGEPRYGVRIGNITVDCNESEIVRGPSAFPVKVAA